jgi:hypothetical protein
MSSICVTMAADRESRRPLGARRMLLLGMVMLIAAACGDSSELRWAGVRAELPAGWEVVASSERQLILADHVAADGGRGVLITFLRAPGTLPDDWRGTVEDRGALLESDEAVLLAGDVPATQLILLDDVDGTRIREALLVIPSRGLVIAITPRVEIGETDGPELLLESLDAVRAFLDGIQLTIGLSG